MSQNHYHVLGIAATATATDVKRAYKRLAVELHPDKHGGSALYEERFKAVAVAYGVLGDPQRRAAYDQQLRQAAQRVAEQQRQQQYRAPTQHVYGVPMPPPAPLRTRRPAGSGERHYRTIPKQRRFTRRDYLLTFGLLAAILAFVLGGKLLMDHVTAVSNYEDGLRAYRRARWSAAHAYFTQALHFKPEFGAALRRRGEIEQLINRDYAAARADYEAALTDAEPAAERAHLLFRVGQCLAGLGEADAAEQSLSVSLALDSTQSTAWLARGEVRLFEQQTFAKAAQDLSTGLRLRTRAGRPLPLKYLTYRGLAYYKMQDLTQARADYRQVLEANPGNGQVHFLLGRLAQQEGNPSAACEFFERAVRLGYTYADEARRQNCP